MQARARTTDLYGMSNFSALKYDDAPFRIVKKRCCRNPLLDQAPEPRSLAFSRRWFNAA
jgi:hypothetical protein